MPKTKKRHRNIPIDTSAIEIWKRYINNCFSGMREHDLSNDPLVNLLYCAFRERGDPHGIIALA